MKKIKAISKDNKISAQKVRLVANLVRGKEATKSVEMLSLMPQKAAFIVRKTLLSAISNAENNEGLDPDELIISEIFVDVGATLKRIKTRAKGRADRILKRSSHLTVCVAEN